LTNTVLQAQIGQEEHHKGGLTEMHTGEPPTIKTLGSNPYQNVHCALEDKSGNLWFGTTGNGVYRFDGKSFTNFTSRDGLGSNSIWSLLEDKSGAIWIGTDAGVTRYNGKSFEDLSILAFNPFNTKPDNFSASINLAKNAVWSMLQSNNGTIWLGTTDGVYSYTGTRFTKFLQDAKTINTAGLRLKMVQSIIEDKRGNIWFASGLGEQEGVCRFDGLSLISFKPDGNSNSRAVLEDNQGNIWLLTQNAGLYLFNGKSFIQFKEKTVFGPHSFNNLGKDRMGNIWIACDYSNANIDDTTGGVWCFPSRMASTPANAVLKNFSTKDGLCNNSVFCMLEDRSGNMWFGTRKTGLCKFDGKVFINYSDR
jgi:ligand-binding sensor domain-containing protein